MDRADYVHRRKGRYMAQVLEAFERNIEPHISPDGAGEVQDFKALVRMRMNALAVDAAELIQLSEGGHVVNGLALEMRDQLHPTGRP